MIDFCAAHDIVSDVEVVPMHSVNEAYERLLKNDVRYRFVIDMASLKVGGARLISTAWERRRLKQRRVAKLATELREAFGVRGACSRLPTAPSLATAPASWTHSIRFARQSTQETIAAYAPWCCLSRRLLKVH